MQQLNFIEAGKLEWREAPEPRLEADREAIVEPVAVATCDLDTLIVRGAVPLQGPFPFGHEGVARVVEVGDAVKDVVPGDLVSIPFQVSCGSCEQCRRGRSAHCQAVPRLSMYGLGALSGGEFGGFLSDRVRVPFADHMLLALPKGVAHGGTPTGAGARRGGADHLGRELNLPVRGRYCPCARRGASRLRRRRTT